MFGLSRKVNCPFQVLFDILDEDLTLGLCCDIFFEYKGIKHRFGAYGDNGETHKNVRYYLDKYEALTLESLKNGVKIDNILLAEFNEVVSVTECDYCYPDTIVLLRPYVK